MENIYQFVRFTKKNSQEGKKMIVLYILWNHFRVCLGHIVVDIEI